MTYLLLRQLYDTKHCFNVVRTNETNRCANARERVNHGSNIDAIDEEPPPRICEPPGATRRFVSCWILLVFALKKKKEILTITSCQLRSQSRPGVYVASTRVYIQSFTSACNGQADVLFFSGKHRCVIPHFPQESGTAIPASMQSPATVLCPWSWCYYQ